MCKGAYDEVIARGVDHEMVIFLRQPYRVARSHGDQSIRGHSFVFYPFPRAQASESERVDSSFCEHPICAQLQP